MYVPMQVCLNNIQIHNIINENVYDFDGRLLGSPTLLTKMRHNLKRNKKFETTQTNFYKKIVFTRSEVT